MRYSSHAQYDGFSIEAQEKAIKKYADEHGYDLQYYYCDKAKQVQIQSDLNFKK